jgi:hypothetical protein
MAGAPADAATRNARWRTALPAFALALAGCGVAIPVTRNAPEAIAVAERSVVVAGPPGYCVDQTATRDRPGGAFVLLGSCASIARDASRPHPVRPGVLTVTVSEDTMSTAETGVLLDALRGYFRTEDGRAALSRSGRPDQVEVLETRIDDGALYLHARDASGPARGMADDYWRALMRVNERLVTLSVNAYSTAPLSDRAGLSTLDDFASRIRAANPGMGAS